MSEFTHIIIEPGPVVVCDLCNKDYTNSNEQGGFLFASTAVCPECAPQFEKQVNRYNEQMYITKRCPSDKSFADWVRNDLRS